MSRERTVFRAEPEPSPEQHLAVAALSPRNPFHTPAYAAAMAAGGARPWLLWLDGDGAPVAACPAFLSRGRRGRRLEIPSLPALPAGDAFWKGLGDFCAGQRIRRLSVNSFASPAATIPTLGTTIQRKPRVEYQLMLSAQAVFGKLSSNHKRNIKRGERAGLTLSVASDRAACDAHVRLTEGSMSRRAARGEAVPRGARIDNIARFTEAGAGALYRASEDDIVHSSMLVLRAASGAYYHSAGTSPDGMAKGASHFLVARVAESLRDHGAECFNLGGADADQTGLIRFKSGFGPVPVELEAADFAVGGRIGRWLTVWMARR